MAFPSAGANRDKRAPDPDDPVPGALRHEVYPFSVDIVRKQIKHIYFRVCHTKKRIRISAPSRISRAMLENAIQSKKAWLIRQVNARKTRTPVSRPSYLSRESVRFKGKPYKIRVHRSGKQPPGIVLKDSYLILSLKNRQTRDNTAFYVEAWLRKELAKAIRHLVEKWESRMSVQVSEYRIRKMKTRWGSCNVTAGRIWLNAALIHFPMEYLEYVVVHEMVHLLERRHNQRFRQYMDTFMPHWRRLEQEMNRIVPA